LESLCKRYKRIRKQKRIKRKKNKRERKPLGQPEKDQPSKPAHNTPQPPFSFSL
jgi:hypothetical protein